MGCLASGIFDENQPLVGLIIRRDLHDNIGLPPVTMEMRVHSENSYERSKALKNGVQDLVVAQIYFGNDIF